MVAGVVAMEPMIERIKALWLILVAVPAVRRTLALLVGLLLGLAVEQVARLGVLPPEVVAALRHALSAL